MNEPAFTRTGLERALMNVLGEILSDVEWLREVRSRAQVRSTSDRADNTVHIRMEKERGVELQVHVKKDLRPGTFHAWANKHRHRGSKKATIPVLAMPFVSPRLADLCRKEGWSWYDLAGNCRINVPGLLLLERNGIAPVRRPPRPRANLGTTAAARVLRALLSPAHAGRVWTQRGLQTETCWRKIDGDKPVSLGLVNKVIRHIRDEGFIEEVSKHGVRVRDPDGLLAEWSRVYRFERHERRSYFSLLKGTKLHEALYLVSLDAGGMAAYAAFSAAERQAPHVRQPRTWIYVGTAFLDSLIHHTQAKEVDSGENLVVLIPEDSGVFLSFEEDSQFGDQVLSCTDPVQTYIDLMHCGGRGEEAAEALLDQKILPAWKELAGA